MAAVTTKELDFQVTAMLCDSVAAENNKLFMQGAGWNVISPHVFPSRVPRIGVAALVHVPYTRTNTTHVLRLRLDFEDGQPVPIGFQPADPGDPTSFPKPVNQVEAQFTVGRPPMISKGDSQVMPFAMNFDGLEFREPGSYSFVFDINNEELARLTFRAVAPGAISRP